MSTDLGHVDVDSTIYIGFTTNDGSGGRVEPNSAFEAADVRIYKNNSATQRSSESGFTMTSPFDSMVGVQWLTVDLSDNTDAGFYAAGSFYTVVLYPDETVDSQNISKILGTFSIGPQNINVQQVSGDATAADNLELACDNYSVTRGLTGTALPAAAADAAGGVPVSDAGGLDIDTLLGYLTAAVATASALTTAQNDLDILTGADGAILNTTQANYAPNKVVPDAAGTAPTAAENFTAVLTTQLTEAYAADGTAPTLAQAIFLIQQCIQEFAIASTTITVKKLDGATTAATYTLDDDTSPTSRTRAS
jgi:hypothetical protein